MFTRLGMEEEGQDVAVEQEDRRTWTWERAWHKGEGVAAVEVVKSVEDGGNREEMKWEEEEH